MIQQDAVERDYYTDLTVLKDPYEYFEEMFAQGPVHQLTKHDVLLVTGYAEAIEVLGNSKDFSAAIAVDLGITPLPFEPIGDDISEQIEANRHKWNGGDFMVAFDGTRHTALRSIVNRLFVPSRMKSNEDFMFEFADQLVKNAVAKGRCELVNEIATPYVTLVIADLMGVPPEDRDLFRKIIDDAPPPGNMERNEALAPAMHPLAQMAMYFMRYLEDRRANPRSDVLTDLATAKYPDGSTPEIIDLVKLAGFMFGAGQDTTAKLIGNAMRFIVETPGLQQRLRNNYDLIPSFIEEVLRVEGSVKAISRLARRDTRIGNVDVPKGKRVVIALAAGNRDPRRWDQPKELMFDRPKVREHIAFSRGAHTCVGAPLARAETRIILERFFERTSEISFSELKHGTSGNGRFEYEPSYIVRGLANLHLELKPS